MVEASDTAGLEQEYVAGDPPVSCIPDCDLVDNQR